MKRKADQYVDIYNHFGLLVWRECQSCKKEFVREWGWSKLCGPFVNGFGKWKFVCKQCCPNKKDADKVFNYVPRRPPPPPPPPPIRKVGPR